MTLTMTMTMTMTHSNKVSTGCQPCPTDSNEEVVTSVKKSLLNWCGHAHHAGGAINTC